MQKSKLNLFYSTPLPVYFFRIKATNTYRHSDWLKEIVSFFGNKKEIVEQDDIIFKIVPQNIIKYQPDWNRSSRLRFTTVK